MKLVDLYGLAMRLAKNTRGNALLLMALGMFPILAAIGSGIDIARAHMAHSKLQQAVDAAALAGRRAMTGNDITTTANEVSSYVAFNFPKGLYGAGEVTTTTSMPESGQVRVDAHTTLPTTIMAIFGKKSFDISASGTAVQSFKNVDIILVLDTTTSMWLSMKGGLVPSGSPNRMDALKDAVRSFYDQLTPAREEMEKRGLRMRFGVVPYSQTVNVGKLLYNLNKGYIQNSQVYHHWYLSDPNNKQSWQFGPQRYSLSNFISGGTIGNINGNNDSSTDTWGGCIEEPGTDSTITGNDSRNSAPSSAFDLKIDNIPSIGLDTKYKPYIYDPRAGRASKSYNGINTYCPAEAYEINTMTKSKLEEILNSMRASGGTYHDIGMLWGTRMLSSNGIWKSFNPDVYNQVGVQRYIVFMTDGVMATPIDSCAGSASSSPSTYCTYSTDHVSAYSGYGIEAFDKRVGGTTDSDNSDRHTKRFLMTCDAAKAKGISIWTVAVATGRVSSLDQCASSIDQSSTAANSNELIARFVKIGKSIGSLRLAD